MGAMQMGQLVLLVGVAVAKDYECWRTKHISELSHLIHANTKAA